MDAAQQARHISDANICADSLVMSFGNMRLQDIAKSLLLDFAAILR